MLLALVVSVAAAAAPTLASPDFSTLNVSGEVARFCNEHLAQQLASRGVQVTTARQISAALGLERQKQLLGCDDAATSCMAELASALGVDGMLLGDIGRLGTKFQVNLRVAKSGDGQVFATWSRSVSREDELLPALTEAALVLAPQILAALKRQAPPGLSVGAAASTRVRTWPLVPTFIGAGLAVASAISFGLSAGAHGRLTDPSLTPGSIDEVEAVGLKTRGELTQGLALGTLVGAGISLGVSIVLYVLSGRDSPMQAVLAPWLTTLRQVQ